MTGAAGLVAPVAMTPIESRLPLRRRRRWVAAAIAIVLLAGAGLSWLTYAETYQPWEPGNVGTSGGPGVQSITDGTRDTSLIVIAPAGTPAAYEMTLRLSGSHDVTVLPQGELDGPGHVHLKWQTSSRDDMGHSPNTATDHALTVRPGDLLTVWILLTRPACEPGVGETLYSVTLRWTALGVRHLYTFPIGNAEGPTPLYVCYPVAALKHLDNGPFPIG